MIENHKTLIRRIFFGAPLSRVNTCYILYSTKRWNLSSFSAESVERFSIYKKKKDRKKLTDVTVKRKKFSDVTKKRKKIADVTNERKNFADVTEKRKNIADVTNKRKKNRGCDGEAKKNSRMWRRSEKKFAGVTEKRKKITDVTEKRKQSRMWRWREIMLHTNWEIERIVHCFHLWTRFENTLTNSP